MFEQLSSLHMPSFRAILFFIKLNTYQVHLLHTTIGSTLCVYHCAVVLASSNPSAWPFSNSFCLDLIVSSKHISWAVFHCVNTFGLLSWCFCACTQNAPSRCQAPPFRKMRITIAAVGKLAHLITNRIEKMLQIFSGVTKARYNLAKISYLLISSSLYRLFMMFFQASYFCSILLQRLRYTCAKCLHLCVLAQWFLSLSDTYVASLTPYSMKASRKVEGCTPVCSKHMSFYYSLCRRYLSSYKLPNLPIPTIGFRFLLSQGPICSQHIFQVYVCIRCKAIGTLRLFQVNYVPKNVPRTMSIVLEILPVSGTASLFSTVCLFFHGLSHHKSQAE